MVMVKLKVCCRVMNMNATIELSFILLLFGKLVQNEKENSDWIFERSVFCSKERCNVCNGPQNTFDKLLYLNSLFIYR